LTKRGNNTGEEKEYFLCSAKSTNRKGRKDSSETDADETENKQ
jgi:hypothetical protein